MNVRVTRNDRLYAGHRARYLVGPLDNMDDLPALRKRLQVIASRGPQSRIGLIPDPSDVSWAFDRTAETVVVTEGPRLDVRELRGSLPTFRSRRHDSPRCIYTWPRRSSCSSSIMASVAGA